MLCRDVYNNAFTIDHVFCTDIRGEDKPTVIDKEMEYFTQS